jgi:FMN-dependent NADH-azoreductase
MKLLHVDSSILGRNSASRSLTAAIVGKWRSEVAGLQVAYRDLARDPLPHLSVDDSDPATLETSRLVLEEFLAADVVVIGAPMYNFSLPSNLKAWIDRIAVAGKTFHYTERGPEGLAGGKKVIVASSRGGVHPADSGRDFVEPYLRWLFSFLGVTDVEFVIADGLAMADRRERSLAEAHATIEGSALPLAA